MTTIQTLLSIAVCLFAGLMMTRALKRLHLPDVTAYLIAGVLINLVDNACSAGAKQITVSARERVISVSDDGCGIPKEILDKVTQPFFRADKARSRQSGHAGLGLALAARVAELHRARLTIESEERAGTTVSIRFDQ